MTVSPNWRAEVSALAQRAQIHRLARRYEDASRDLDAAFDRVQSEQDVVFVVVLVTAADFAFEANEVESAASLYKRGVIVLDELRSDDDASEEGTDLPSLFARCYLGLARADAARGYAERARERYVLAGQWIRHAGEVPPEIADEIRAACRPRST